MKLEASVKRILKMSREDHEESEGKRVDSFAPFAAFARPSLLPNPL